jgi:hypothetical protein
VPPFVPPLCAVSCDLERVESAMKDLVIIMRAPCLMEDEGRHFHIDGPLPREEAEKWIAAQKDEYFRPSDYYLVPAGKRKR